MSFTTEEIQQVEDFEALSVVYRDRLAKYNEQLKAYREAEADGRENPDLKAILDKEYDELHQLYGRLRGLQRELGQAQDAALA